MTDNNNGFTPETDRGPNLGSLRQLGRNAIPDSGDTKVVTDLDNIPVKSEGTGGTLRVGGTISTAKTDTVRTETPGQPHIPETQQSVRKSGKRALTKEQKQQRKKKNARNLLLSCLLVIFIVVASAGIGIFALTCVNDILAMNRSKDKVVVSISEGIDTNDAITLFKKQGLIKNAFFCKLFNTVLLTFDDETEYIPGVYELSPSMGLEVMLTKISSNTTSNDTVTLTFPEGYTVDQIIEKLDVNDVCSANSLRQTMLSVDFSSDFDFLPSFGTAAERYHLLEGYMFPDTYDFYIGENPSSVIKKFLANFEKRWSEDFEAQSRILNLTMDEVLTLASIIEKESWGSDQMYAISSILHNRLENSDGTYKYLSCDSTVTYISDISPQLISQEQRNTLTTFYDTYQRSGIPNGPICNPGIYAIKAALNPTDTDYYYFCHDVNKQIYLARNEAEHTANWSKVVKVNSDAQASEGD